MPTELTLPKLGLTMETGSILEWYKSEGAWVNCGEVIYTAESDKATYDVEATADGFIHIEVAGGAELPVGARVGFLAQTMEEYRQLCASEGHDLLDAPAGSSAAPARERAEVGGRTREPARFLSAGRPLISPAARRLAADQGVDVSGIRGSGPNGAVIKVDIVRAMEGKAGVGSSAVGRLGRGRTSARVEALSGLRRTIARRMCESLHTTAQMTAFGRVDASALQQIKSAFRDRQRALGVHVTLTDVLLRIIAAVIRELPIFNASLIEDEIHFWSEINIGLAVATDDGLMVPVIHDADKLTVTEIAKRRRDLVERARLRRLRSEDLTGGTFTFTNFGTYGGDLETPILNPPEVAIIGVGQIRDEPVAIDGQLQIRPTMGYSFTVDHRLIDGAVSGEFRARFKSMVERPIDALRDVLGGDHAQGM